MIRFLGWGGFGGIIGLVLVVGGVAVMEGTVVWGRTPWPPRYPHPSPLPPNGRGDGCCGRGGRMPLAASLLSEPRITLIFADGP